MTVLLHGFWGQPSDWADVLRQLPITEAAVTPDLYEPGPLAPNHPLEQWTNNFLKWLDETCGAQPVQLVGYSMGARLALHALVERPPRFERALLLSGAPFINESTFSDRERWEQAWSAKFLTQPWAELKEAWQEQEVFRNTSGPPVRRQSDAHREWLAASLINWSPRRHTFAREELKQLSARVEYAYGALDQKYVEVAKTLQELPVQGQITLVPNAGHRLPTDAADFIARWITGSTSHG